MRLAFLTSFFLLIPGLLAARQWDPRLLQVSRLTYQGELKEAESALTAYRQTDPRDPNGLFLHASLLDWKTALQGEPEEPAHREMLSVYKQANRLAFENWRRDPENVDRLIDLGNSYLFLGRKYYDTGSPLRAALTAKKCQPHLEKALRLDPSRVDGLLALGGFHYFASRAPAGLSIFKKILGIRGTREQGLDELKRAMTGEHPFQWDAQYALIYLYTDYEKDYGEALRILNELERRFPKNPAIRYKRPMILEKMGPLKGADAYLHFTQWCEGMRGRCHDSYLFLGYFHSGRLFEETGQPARARELLAAALKHDGRLYPEYTARALEGPRHSSFAAPQFSKGRNKP